MADEIELLQLEAGEDAARVRDRLAGLRGRSVLIVWPERGTALARKLDLVLVQREAKRLAIRLALVTRDPDVIRFASELQLSVFDSIGSSGESRWRRGRARGFAGRDHRPDDAPDVEELMPLASRVRAAQPADSPRQRAIGWIGRIVAGVLLIALALGVGYALIPSAVVIITPAHERIEAQAEIIADPDLQSAIDPQAGIIPAFTLRIEIEERGAIPTTGALASGGDRARGSVVFINRTADAIPLPANLAVTTSASAPVFFRTLQSATVPAGIGLQIEVPVEAAAESAGEIGNVPAGTINTVIGALAATLEVRNVAPTSGGAVAQTRIVTADDRDRLVATLRQGLQQRAYTEMIARIGPSDFILPESIRIDEERDDWKTFDHTVGESAETLSLTMRAVIEAIAVDGAVAENVAFARLTAQLPSGGSVRERTCTRGGVTFEADGRVRFTVTCAGEIAAPVEAAALRDRLARLPIDEAQRYLESAVASAAGVPPRIEISPAGLGVMPLFPLRIAIRVVDAPTALPAPSGDARPTPLPGVGGG